MEKYKTRVVKKRKEDGSWGYRVEFWQYHTKWIDALQGWFDTEHEAYTKARAMEGKMTQERLL